MLTKHLYTMKNLGIPKKQKFRHAKILCQNLFKNTLNIGLYFFKRFIISGGQKYGENSR